MSSKRAMDHAVTVVIGPGNRYLQEWYIGTTNCCQATTIALSLSHQLLAQTKKVEYQGLKESKSGAI
jgi:hypothetical protein